MAVIDSGIAWDHVALGGGFGPGYRVVGGWDFAENDSNPYDDGPVGYHGTHVAGLLGGNADQVQGIAPGSDIVGLRVFDDMGGSELAWIESALQWVHDNQNTFESPITTVNLSIGAALSDANRIEASEMLGDELQQLRDDGILVFAAAGNFYGTEQAEGDNQILFPASDPSVVAISSVDASGNLSDFAQRQSGILATQGENINSSVPDHVLGWDGNVNDFASLDGTSMATPQVAGASMLIRQAMLDAGLEPTAEQVLQRLEQAAVERTDSDTGQTYRTVDLQQAIESIQGEGRDSSTQNETTQETSSEPIKTIDHFIGSVESEKITLDLRDGIKLSAGSEVYNIQSGSSGNPFVIDVGGGADSIHIIGSEASERLLARPNSALGEASSIATNNYEIELRGFEEIRFDGGGGFDRATMYDSSGDDKLTSQAEQVIIDGVGFRFEVNQVPRSYVHATAGGSDTAFLFDSVGDDELTIRPQFSSVRGASTFQLAYGFEEVYAFASNGGNDIAEIYDSLGDDTLSVSASRTMITGPDYQVIARGFGSVVGYANAGGDDLANLYSSQIESDWSVTSDMVQLTSDDGATRVARGFERVAAFEQFQPIELGGAQIRSLIADADERRELAELEANATRSVFDQLGAS